MRRAFLLVLLLLPGAVVVVTGLGIRPGGTPLYRELATFAGRDVAGLAPAARTRLDECLAGLGILGWRTEGSVVDRILGAILPRAPGGPVGEPSRWGFHSPARVLAVPDALVVATEETLVSIPGNPEFGLFLVRPNGDVRATGPFPTGYRTVPGTVSLRDGDRLGTVLVEIRPGGAIGGSPDPLVLALRGDRFVLVRLEDPDGAHARNHYGAPNFTVGPPPPPRTEEEWVALLNSHEVLDRLEALVWIAGTHLDPERPEPGTWHEDLGTARLWWRIVNREDVKAALRSLADSDEPWEAEAARAALAPSLYRP